MSRWKIAAAQYEPLKTSVREHIIHHLKFIDAAARQQCELLVFPLFHYSAVWTDRSRCLRRRISVCYSHSHRPPTRTV